MDMSLPPTIPDTVITSLSAHIEKCYSEAKQSKEQITQRLLSCHRQRKGEYEPRLRAMIAQSGGQEIFMMLTDIKCRAADAWIKDVMQNHNEATWALNPTTEPELPPEIGAEIEGVVMQEAAAVAASGMPIEPETMSMRQNEVLQEATVKVREEATLRCKRMEDRIIDKLEEGRWRDALGEVIYDFTTYPAAFIKGPVLRKKRRMKWGPNFTPVVAEEVVIDVDRISPYDIFPGPSAVSIQDSYLLHRQRLTRSALRNMKGLKGSRPEIISEAINQFREGYRTILPGDNEYELLNNNNLTHNADGLFETLEYWGPAAGFMLIEWGMTEVDGNPVDPDDEYQINAWKVANHVIRVVINPDPLGRRPYSKACFEEIPGSFWGTALPEMMKDVQIMCNASARALANNMGLASGPQVEVNVDRLPPGASITSMFPWKVWQTTNDRSGSGQPAIRFFQPDMNAAELLNVYQHFTRVADEVTGVPNYVYGSTNVSGAGRTASGLSMLMENAAKGIKHAIMALDRANSEVVHRIYTHLMMHDPDQAIKGDMQVVAAGAIGAMIREQQEVARREFMAATLNPVDTQIIGVEGRAYMLRETAKGIFPDIDKVVPNPQRMRELMMQQQLAAQQAAPQQETPMA